MPEAQYTVSGFNIAGLDPIEVAKPVTGTSITLADSDIGKMNVFSGSASTAVTLPAATGNLDGYPRPGRAIGFRGAHDMTALIKLMPPAGTNFAGAAVGSAPTAIPIAANHILILYAAGSAANPLWVIAQHRWPPQSNYVLAYRGGSTQALSNGVNDIVCNTLLEGNEDGVYNTATGIYSPSVPGLYDLKMCATATASATTTYLGYIAKNGTASKSGGRTSVASGANASASAAAFLRAAWTSSGVGVADNFQPLFQTTVGTATLLVSSAECWFEARYVGPY